MSTPAFGIGADVWPGLSKVVEEKGELGQVLGKIIATGGEHEHWDGTNLCVRMIEELGDLRAALDYFEFANGLSQHHIEVRRAKKFATFMGWHDDAQAALCGEDPDNTPADTAESLEANATSGEEG